MFANTTTKLTTTIFTLTVICIILCFFLPHRDTSVVKSHASSPFNICLHIRQLSLVLSFSVILCFPNDYNNEALSSASTTDAQNILSLNLSLSLCLFSCFISTFSLSFILIHFSYQTSHSSTNWNLITSHKHLFQSVCSDFHKFWEVHLTILFGTLQKVL